MKLTWILLAVVATLAVILTLRFTGVFDQPSAQAPALSTVSSSTAAQEQARKVYKIVFATQADTYTSPDGWQINIINDDGSGLTRITDTDGIPEPRWSPDGKTIAYMSKINNVSQIFTMKVDGSNQKQLTNGQAHYYSPSWSPDGNKIAFVSNLYSKQEAKDDVCLMNADGSNKICLTFTDGDNSVPIWSPDGKKIAFSHKNGDYYQIYAMDPDGSQQVALTNNTDNCTMLSWSPDGKKIAFTRENDSKYQIYIMNADGSGQKALTDPGTNNWAPYISPDGRRIAFVSNRDKTANIYIMNIDGSNQVQLTYSILKSSVCPDWSPGAFSLPQGPSLTTITNSGYYSTAGYSIDYPSDWHVESNSGGNTMIASPVKNGGFISITTLPSMSKLVPNMPPESIETIVSRSINSSKGVWKNFTIIENRQLSGTWDWLLVYSHTMEFDGKEEAWQNREYIRKTDEASYQLMLGSRTVQASEYPLDKIAASFKILPK